jgi:hypothetical protein
LFFHNLAQKNFLGCCPVSAGEDELIRSIDLFCRIIGDNPKKFLSFFFSSSYRTEFFSPPCLVIFWPEDRGITRMVLLQNRNMRRRSAFFIIFLILFFEREKRVKNFFLLLPLAAGRCASLSAVQLDVVC